MLEIFGTLGPACCKEKLLEKMFLEGMTGIRLNMSHSGLRESEELLLNYHQAARHAGVQPELLIDMQGPEIRIGALREPLTLKEGEEIGLVKLEHFVGDGIPVPGQVISVLTSGDHILLDDGKLELRVTVFKPEVKAAVIRGGILRSRKSLKVADKYIAGPAITRQDRENIRLAGEFGVTALMQPFVTSGNELIEVREELKKNHMEHLRIFAKIENRQGMEHIRDILPFADMIVIARGDLGNDMPLWKLPAAQKELAEVCREAGKPFLVVTQMLASMTEHPYPTRAEVSDIFHAVCDGADAVMVTNETAEGRYPAEAIRYLKKTAEEALRWREG